ncbi:D-erythronate dehydrogenase-like [Pectinophora gossypiella]|uniref:D-erythronate dehydrogenase-like n=1 Tax=Pectinophora gossypiella TaxID=13191 RepID=UPI00214F5841|nr:D-erythronate dehydrogenase-like [Pectinophora gossypiella]XP_049875160.1 D-erythronate dehydrogenase-like [Pectinophora gossypiella]
MRAASRRGAYCGGQRDTAAMKVVVTGAAGFLGARLAARLAAGDAALPVTELLLVDVVPPPLPPRAQVPVATLVLELGAPGAAQRVIAPDTDVLFHLAAVVSGHAEADLELGLRVNFDATRALLDEAARTNPALRLVFASTVGVFGGELPDVVDDLTALTPQNSYGTAKAMSELLIDDYSRRGLVDGRSVRLPTVSVRAGAANRAVTSFASGIVREPLAGLPADCPVPLEQRLWLCSPAAALRNLQRAATVPAAALGERRALTLPGLSVAVGDMLAALAAVAGPAVTGRVRLAPDAAVARMVASFPAQFTAARALRLGFTADASFEDIIRDYIRDELGGSYVH